MGLAEYCWSSFFFTSSFIADTWQWIGWWFSLDQTSSMLAGDYFRCHVRELRRTPLFAMCVSYLVNQSVSSTQFIEWLICLYTLLVLLTESVCLFLGFKPQYIEVLMASFLVVLLRGFGGQDGMINQPLTDKLIHCRV